ncbi:MAG: hypothetical protein AB8B55_23070 [Mariniblastus sp.]
MLKKSLVNIFLVGFLLVMLIDPAPRIPASIAGVELPQLRKWQGQLKDGLDPYLDATGLWQGDWRLFAPSPDKINASVTAEVAFEDGKIVLVKTPNWREISAWERFVKFREAEFVDGVRNDNNRAIWPTYADYLRRTVKHPTDEKQRVTEVLLSRRWANIAPPDEFNILEFPEPPMKTGSYIMFVKRFKQ